MHVCQHVCAFLFYHLGNGFDFTHLPALFDLPLTICVLLCVISMSLEQLICAMRWGLVCAPIDYPAGITEVWLFIEASPAVEDQTRAAVHG